MQPTAVWNSATKEVLLQGNCLLQVNQATSKDLGRTWSDMRRVDSNLGRGAGTYVGPGVGLQLSTSNPHAPGRILFIGHHGAYREDFIWFSDDNGKTYHLAETSLKGMDEAQLVELSDGRVMASM